MVTLISYPSRWRLTLILLGAIGFVLIGLAAVGAFGTPWVSRRASPMADVTIGWIVVAFFGLCAISAGRMFFETEALLRIDQHGIRWRRWSDDLIPWSEITDVTMWQHKGQKTIVLHLRDPAQFPGKGIMGWAGKANRALTGGDIGITMTGTDRSVSEAMAAIEHYRQ